MNVLLVIIAFSIIGYFSQILTKLILMPFMRSMVHTPLKNKFFVGPFSGSTLGVKAKFTFKVLKLTFAKKAFVEEVVRLNGE